MYSKQSDGYILIPVTGCYFLNSFKRKQNILLEDYEDLKKNIIKILEKKKFISDYDGIFSFKFYESFYCFPPPECHMICKLKKGVFHTDDSDPSIYIDIGGTKISLWHKNGALRRKTYENDYMRIVK